ncbi:MAG: GNAT family acetyltransferase, partial [Thermoleophilia bacterium]|nr:GNAT family acetyltransferase [Thermoleophilia bacterium]
MTGGEQIEIRRLGPAEARAELDALAGVLVDCVNGGASVR